MKQLNIILPLILIGVGGGIVSNILPIPFDIFIKWENNCAYTYEASSVLLGPGQSYPDIPTESWAKKTCISSATQYKTVKLHYTTGAPSLSSLFASNPCGGGYLPYSISSEPFQTEVYGAGSVMVTLTCASIVLETPSPTTTQPPVTTSPPVITVPPTKEPIVTIPPPVAEPIVKVGTKIEQKTGASLRSQFGGLLILVGGIWLYLGRK